LKKLFAGIFNVEFTPVGNNITITSMISSVGEYVKLDEPVMITGVLEDWLNDLTTRMFRTLELL